MTPRTPDERCENCPAWDAYVWYPWIRFCNNQESEKYRNETMPDDWCIPGIKLMREGKSDG